MNVRRVKTRADLRRFTNFPYRHYRNDPNWVPPLRGEQRRQFHPAANPMLGHVEYALFLLEEEGRVCGRIAAFLDRLALAHWGEPIGLFGSLECIQDQEAARLLLGAAADWLRARGMTRMRGPWSFTSQEWGLVLEGFTPPPVVMGPYNPPWYNELLIGWGLGKIKDLLVYYIDSAADYEIPLRYLSLTDRIASRLGLTTGIWLSHFAARPLNTWFITVHKLIALGAVVLAVLSFLGLLKGAHLQAVILTSLIVAGLAVIALFATGALLSQGKPVQKLLLLVHAYAPIAAAAGAGLAVYLLAGRR